MSAAGGEGMLRFARPQLPRASIVITAWRDAPHLFDCLTSLHDTSPQVPFELLVCANEPAADLRERLDRQLQGATVLCSPLNLGFAGAVNRGAARAGAELLVLLNDDAVVEPGWLEALVAAAEDEPLAGAVGGRVLAPDGAPREDGTVLWSDGSVTLIDAYYRPSPHRAPGVRRVDHSSAVSLLVRKAVWDEVGGFDEGYFPAYYEDVDLAFKIHSLGRPVLYQPASIVRHHQGASVSARYRHFLLHRNTARLRSRWEHELAERPAPDPHNPAALAAALRWAEGRELKPTPGPAVPDDTSPPPPEDVPYYLAKQRDVAAAYARCLEDDLDARDSGVASRSRRWLTTRSKAGLRRFPWAYRGLARRRRRGPGPR